MRGKTERFSFNRLFFVDRNYHFEMEMKMDIAIGTPAFRGSQDEAQKAIHGYAAGLERTRRDLRLLARDKDRTWDLGKGVEQSSVFPEIMPLSQAVISQGAIKLEVHR